MVQTKKRKSERAVVASERWKEKERVGGGKESCQGGSHWKRSPQPGKKPIKKKKKKKNIIDYK